MTAAAPPGAGAPGDGGVAAELVGTWDLTSWTWSLDGVHRGHPMGVEARGLLLYTAEGTVSAVLCTGERAPFGTEQLHLGTPEQRDLAALTYVHYAGTWEVRGDEVVHHVELALFPDWVGTDLVRRLAFDGDQLVLTTAPQGTRHGEAVNELRWRRRALPSGAPPA